MDIKWKWFEKRDKRVSHHICATQESLVREEAKRAGRLWNIQREHKRILFGSHSARIWRVEHGKSGFVSSTSIHDWFFVWIHLKDPLLNHKSLNGNFYPISYIMKKSWFIHDFLFGFIDKIQKDPHLNLILLRFFLIIHFELIAILIYK